MWVGGRRPSLSRAVVLVVGTLLLLVLLPVPDHAQGVVVKNSTFQGTTYLNEHFVMEIGKDGAALTDISTGELLLRSVGWIVEEEIGGSWIPLDWSEGPVLSTKEFGVDNEFHRVAVDGVMADRLGVSILYDGRPLDRPESGPKQSVVLQSIEYQGTFRLVWSLSGPAPEEFQIEYRQGDARRLVRGPVRIPLQLFHEPLGDNSLVALTSRGEISFGANWEDASDYYQGIRFSTDTENRIDVIFGEIELGFGEGFVLDPLLEGGGGGGNPSVSISDLQIDPNSFSGQDTKFTWVTNPATACDVFEWGPTTSYGNTINLPCGTHTVTLTGLNVHQNYYYKITSSKSGWASGVEAGGWYPVDASLSKAYEAYDRDSSWVLCGYGVDISYFAETPGDIEFDPARTSNPNNYEVFDMHIHFESVGTPILPFPCWPYWFGTKRVRFDISVWDSDGIVDWVAAKNHVILSGYSGGSATVSWGITVGAELGEADVGFSAFVNPPSGWVLNKNIDNLDLGNGWKHLGDFTIDWPLQAYVTMDAILPIFVFDQKAQYRLYDQVRFLVEVKVWYDKTTGLWWHGWEQYTDEWSFTLGTGNWNGNNILDQYTNVQSGYVTGPEN